MTEKVDVFAFGVVALEIVAGESNYQNTFEEDTTYIFERVRSARTFKSYRLHQFFTAYVALSLTVS